MRCVEAQKLIKPYLYHELTDSEMAKLLEHIEHCPDCHEELEISMAVYTAIDADADEAEDYNFTRRLEQQLKTDSEELEKRSIASGINKLVIMAAEIALVLVMIAALSAKVNQRMAAQRFAQEHSLLMETEMETGQETETEPETKAETEEETVNGSAANANIETAANTNTETDAERTKHE